MLISCSNRTLTHIPFHPIGKEGNNDSPPQIQKKSAIPSLMSGFQKVCATVKMYNDVQFFLKKLIVAIPLMISDFQKSVHTVKCL